MPKKLSGTGTHRGFGFADFLTKEDAKVSQINNIGALQIYDYCNLIIRAEIGHQNSFR